MKMLLSGAVSLTLFCLVMVEAQTTTNAPPTDANYMILVPRVVRPGRDVELSISILKASSAVTVEAIIYNEKDNNGTIASTSNVFYAGSPDTMIIPMPSRLPAGRTQNQYSTQQFYGLSVRGSGGLTFSQSQPVQVDRKSMSIFVQTDKAMYKPAQNVQFRVFAVGPDLKPNTDPFIIEIIDPLNNKIKQWKDQTDPENVISLNLELSDQPPLGLWKIKAVNGETEYEKTFEVAEYVLPKFEVKVEVPSYHTVNRGDLKATVTATYTYGQPVKGKASVLIRVKYERDSKYMKRTLELVDGKAEMTLTIQDLSDLISVPTWANKDWDPLENLNYKIYEFEANVTETVTGKMLSGSGEVPMKRQDVILEFTDATPETFKSGLNFVAFLQVKQPDGQPVEAVQVAMPNGDPRIVSIKMQATGQETMEQGKSKTTISKSGSFGPFNFTVPVTGLIQVPIDIPEGFDSITLTTEFKPTTGIAENAYKNIQGFKSRDKEGIQITLAAEDTTIKAETTAIFNVKVTEPIMGFYIQVMSKGLIVHSNSHQMDNTTTATYTLSVDNVLASQMAPTARIFAWYITKGGEVIVDTFDFTVEGAFANDVSVDFSLDKARPAENVRLTVHAYPSSYVGVLAVDKSVLLLKGGNDITQDEVLEELRKYDTNSHYYPMPYWRRKKRSMMPCRYFGCFPYMIGGKDAKELFGNAGVLVFTDAYVHSEPRINHWGPDSDVVMSMAGPPPRMAVEQMAPLGPEMALAGPPMAGSANKDGSSMMEVGRVRNLFPESWLWMDTSTGPDGTVNIDTTVPDTMTSWIASAFSLSDVAGLGVSPDQAKLEVFKPFFVSLSLPYSLIRKEEFKLKATVFNYLETDQEVRVTLEKSIEFKVRIGNDVNAEPVSKEVIKTITVPANDALTVSFWIVPYVLGHISITTKAQSTSAADGLKRTILVEPEGAPLEYTKNVFIDLTDTNSFEKELMIEFPTTGLVPGSERVVLTVIGDIMGSLLNNLKQLIRMPYGCGEQNMINFVPNIVVLRYLEATSQGTEKNINDAKSFMEKGYQRELQYQRKDGSFSAFGDRDEQGSTWLTAFVAKSFHQADSYITIDEENIGKSLKFLINQQVRDGSFKEDGVVHHQELKGGSGKGIPLTAYVLITLIVNRDLETSDKQLPDNINAAIMKTTTYLEGVLDEIKDEKYTLAIVSYALTLADSSEAPTFFGKLKDLATTEVGLAYWKDDKAQEEEKQKRHWYRRPLSREIETTSYAMMTSLLQESLANSIPYSRWLVSQQNQFGGYSSSQDTVVGIQALAAFAEQAYSGAQQDIMLSVATSTGISHDFDKITKDNALILQTFELSSSVDTLTLKGKGSGIALAQLSVQYYSTEMDEDKSVEIILVSESLTETEVQVEICAKWLKDDEESGMVNLELNALSGHLIDTTDLLENNKRNGMKRAELEGKKLVTYWDQLTTKNTCFKVVQYRVDEVSNLQMARAEVYAYYSPNKRDTKFYLPVALASGSAGDYCNMCPDCCDGEVIVGKKKKVPTATLR